MLRHRILWLLLSAILLVGSAPRHVLAAAPQDYVVMRAAHVNLRTGPSTLALVVGKAEKGDIFRLVGRSGEWYQILMFSGETRYVTRADFVAPLHASQIVEGHGMRLPESTARCRSLFWDAESAEDRAAREAAEVLPPTLNHTRYTKLKKIFEDRHLLETFHIHGVQPALYRALIARARREGW